MYVIKELYMRITPDFTLFFGEKDFLSNWFPSPFYENGLRFLTNEHYIMYKKALLFKDDVIANEIFYASLPRKARDLGREVKNFKPDVWEKYCEKIVYDGALLKFTSSDNLLKQILSTHPTILVETSPYDKIWGIGLSANDPRVLDPDKWLGQNKLGRVLTEVRDHLIKEINHICKG